MTAVSKKRMFGFQRNVFTMSEFKYVSNCQSNSLFIPFATDTNNQPNRDAAVRFMRNYEKELVRIIEEMTDCSASHYILGDKKVVAMANTFDDATLIAEALACHSPYYRVVDMISHEGLREHLLAVDCHNDKTNHIAKLL